MTMHLLTGLTSINTRKPKVKITKTKMNELKERFIDHNRSLKLRNEATITFEQFLSFVYGKKSNNIAAVPTVFNQTPYRRECPNIPSLAMGNGSCSKNEPKVYTGDAILGIGMLHKSNLVPIFSNKEAEDIAKMRRG